MYEQYLKELLEPLRVYDLGGDSFSGAACAAAGQGLDRLSAVLDRVEREALTATAEEEGLTRREALFARRPVAVTAQERRQSIAALLQIDGDSLTPSAMERTMRGSGIRARAEERGNGRLRVRFPDVAGVPEEFEQIRDIILEILPCHLEVEFYFRYLLWWECERAGITWGAVEAAQHSWKSFQLAVPPED